jgi:hypothetical protein
MRVFSPLPSESHETGNRQYDDIKMDLRKTEYEDMN